MGTLAFTKVPVTGEGQRAILEQKIEPDEYQLFLAHRVRHVDDSLLENIGVDAPAKAGVEGKTRIHIHTPLITLTKAGIVKLAVELGLDFSLTHSCYDPDALGRACGQCDSCLLRKKGFEEAGIWDPLRK